MKILLIFNSVIPQIADLFHLPQSNSGGWLSAFFESLKNDNDYTIAVCFPYNGQRISASANGVSYYSFCEKRPDNYDPKLEHFFESVLSSELPAIVHIFGTEFAHTLAAVKACKNKGVLNKCVINIQGIITACASKYYANLPKKAIYGFTLRDFLKADNVYFQKKRFEKRGRLEIEALKTVKNVVGRTDWDNKLVKAINRDITYYFCNESLRPAFYEDRKWNYEYCEKHSIFISQSYYPLKGLHNLIGVFADIVKKYPDTHIYTTGNGGNYNNFWLNLKHKTYYQRYLLSLIKKHNLENNIIFLGDLNAEEMRERLLKTNVFVLSSSVENSSNSLGEAMLLGVPCISSNVGGISSLLTHDREGLLYPFDNPEIANKYIEKIFSDTEFARYISLNAIKRAEITYSPQINENSVKEVYSQILRGT